jgi:hypothetical protein
MPFDDDEQSTKARDRNQARTLRKETGNGTAGLIISDGEFSSDDGLLVDKSKKKRKGDLTWSMMQGWETGEEAVLTLEDIDKEIYELARRRMAVTDLKPLPDDSKESSDIAMWKLIREKRKDSGATLVRLYQCPMRNQCGCMAGLRITEAPGWTQLDRCGTHNANSHICAPVCVNHITALCPAFRSVLSEKNQVAELGNRALKDKRRPTRGFAPRIEAYDSSNDDTDATPHYKAIMKQLAAEKEDQVIVLFNCNRNCLTCVLQMLPSPPPCEEAAATPVVRTTLSIKELIHEGKKRTLEEEIEACTSEDPDSNDMFWFQSPDVPVDPKKRDEMLAKYEKDTRAALISANKRREEDEKVCSHFVPATVVLSHSRKSSGYRRKRNGSNDIDRNWRTYARNARD